MVENIITIIIIFINVKKNITTRAPSELRISEFTLIFSINSRLLADILSYLGNGSNSSWLRFYSDNLSKNMITTFTTIIILIALVTTLMPVSLRLASNQPQNRFCWFHSDSPCLTRNRHILLVVMWVDQVKKGCPPKASLGILSVKGAPFNFVNASPLNAMYKGGGGSPDSKFLWACVFLAYLIITIW